jgi:YidC/Oxa1 family membrane protein insertase
MQSLIKDIGKIFQPLLDAVGGILAFFYSIIPNYPIDVALLTVLIMALITPLTVKSTKNMAAMQALGPEMKKLQQKYKGAENRALMNEEMMKLYKEHNVNPASGCLPMLLQMPAFFVLYSVIRGITNTVTIPAHTVTVDGFKKLIPMQVKAVPRYIPNPSKMRTDIVAAHGELNSFGMNFAEKLLSHHSSWYVAIPYLLLVAGAVGLQYLQMSRLNARNPQASKANPQAAMLQKYMPLIFGFIYLNVAAILNVYFIVSSAIRILTQEILFRKGLVAGPPAAPVVGAGGANGGGTKKGPAVDRTERALPKPKTAGGGSAKAAGTAGPAAKAAGRTAKAAGGSVKANADLEATGGDDKAGGSNGSKGGAAGSRGTSRTRPRAKPTGSANGSNGQKPGAGGRNGSAGTRKSAGSSTNGSNGSGAMAADDDGATPSKEHPRSKAKRERKAR